MLESGGRRPMLRGSMSSSSTSLTQTQTISENSTTASYPSAITYPSFASSRPNLNGYGYTSPSSPSTTYPSSSTSPFTYPSAYTTASSSSSSSHPNSYSSQYDITSPPQASLSPSLTRRRSDYIDQSQEALSLSQSHSSSGYPHQARSPIEYPVLAGSNSHQVQHMIRPPPLAASSPLGERQNNRAPLVPSSFPNVNGVAYPNSASTSLTPPVPPRIPSTFPVTYFPSSPAPTIGISGLKNLGNTCYMNAPIQCLSATYPFARFFLENKWKNAVNMQNKMGSKGALTSGFAGLLRMMWNGGTGDLRYLNPGEFRKTVCQLNSQYIGTDQHDSQEFLSFLLDGIHEDLNRILIRPNIVRTPEDEEKLEKLPAEVASEQEWKLWRESNDSVIVDYFQGQLKNQLKCLTCSKASTTYNAFSILSVPVPHGRSGKVPLKQSLDAFFNAEILENDDAWDCPQCKTKRPAAKQLSLARLPPILVIHLKRFEANGRFSDKVDTFVDFPLKALDMTGYMPASTGIAGAGAGAGVSVSSPDDPRTQVPPYRYDLYGVTNHVGNLSSGHYTAFVASRDKWMYCDDSVVKTVDSKQVVSQKAYVLFYKRTQI
ncbi:hypothetical protein D9758_008023 [Tetrapyrgos nigripes]|uniref:Ubiquitin carboxyl-terminal hydrolase n=1 Tax=Tetrapyrgos nigripes TaxID=182062 RepID=A0A8H5D0M1_9AGAR|nr:hypothetical protein D9758_008023 [Tetrapyrgos nigripes]